MSQDKDEFLSTYQHKEEGDNNLLVIKYLKKFQKNNDFA